MTPLAIVRFLQPRNDGRGSIVDEFATAYRLSNQERRLLRFAKESHARQEEFDGEQRNRELSRDTV